MCEVDVLLGNILRIIPQLEVQELVQLKKIQSHALSDLFSLATLSLGFHRSYE